MRKNLVIGCVGPTSLHKKWIEGDRNFDLFLVYYGTNEGDTYKVDADLYKKARGTKFNIVGDLEISDQYDFIFVPDDDLHIDAHDINRLFEYAEQYHLEICQPSLAGYYSVPQNLHHPGYILRYTDYVEIICPCFSQNAFQKCKHTFAHNRSCWGIEKLWDKELGHPQDKIAIVDDVIAVHTRPCFNGDNYRNNKIEEPWKDIGKIVSENQLQWEIKEYGHIKKDVFEIPHERRCHPPLKCIEEMCERLFKEPQRSYWV